MYFWSDNMEWIGPGAVVLTGGRIVKVRHNELTYFAGLYEVRWSARNRCDCNDESSQNDKPVPDGCDAIWDSPKIANTPAICVAKIPRNYKTQAKDTRWRKKIYFEWPGRQNTVHPGIKSTHGHCEKQSCSDRTTWIATFWEEDCVEYIEKRFFAQMKRPFCASQPTRST